MDLKALLKDKKFLGVAGIGGVAGLVILLRRGGGGGGGQGDGGTPDGGSSGASYNGLPSSGSLGGVYDSTSADIASQLADFKQQQRDALSEFATQQLKATTDAIQAIPVKTPAPVIVRVPVPTPVPAPRPGTKPAVKPTPRPAGKYVAVKKGETFSSWAKRNHISIIKARQLNPGLQHFPTTKKFGSALTFRVA